MTSANLRFLEANAQFVCKNYRAAVELLSTALSESPENKKIWQALAKSGPWERSWFHEREQSAPLLLPHALVQFCPETVIQRIQIRGTARQRQDVDLGRCFGQHA